MNRYEREIEEILRNLDQAEPKANRRTKSGNRPRKRAGMRMSQPHLSFRLSQAEWLLLTALVAALVAGGYAFTLQRRDLFTLILVLIAVVCLILVACSQFIFRSRPPKSLHYGNITI